MMRKKTLGLIGGGVLVAALAAVTVVLLQTAPETDEDSGTAQESSTESIVLTQQEANDVTSIDVTNATGSFQVVRTAEATEDEDAAFAIAGWEDLTMDTTIRTLANNTASMEADAVVEENCTDLEKFGLDDAQATQVELHFADGTSYAFRVGSEVSGGDTTYFAEADSDTVYTVKTSYLANFEKADVDFISTTILAAPASEEAYPTVETLTVARSDMSYLLELDYDETAEDSDSMSGTISTHQMVSPVEAYLNVDDSTPVITGMFGLTAESVLTPHPTETDIQAAGLDEPFGTATMVCDDGNTYVLRFGEAYTVTDDAGSQTTCYAVMLDGVDVIYQVAQEDLVWATVTPTDVASKLIFGTYVWDVGTLEVSVGDVSIDFSVQATGKDDAQVTSGGETADSERYRQFYSFLLNTTAETVELDGDTTGEVLAEIHLTTQDGTLDQTLQFYALDDFTCLITKDGVSAYTCRRSYLDVLQHNIEIFDTTEDFRTNWS